MRIENKIEITFKIPLLEKDDNNIIYNNKAFNKYRKNEWINYTLPIFIVDDRKNIDLQKNIDLIEENSNLKSPYDNEYLIGFTNSIKFVEENYKEKSYKEKDYKENNYEKK